MIHHFKPYKVKDFGHCAFFKPEKFTMQRKECAKSEPEQTMQFPNPLDRYRIPTPRLVPRGYKSF